MSGYVIEVMTVGGGCVRFGPYGLDAAQEVLDEFQLRLGSDDMVFGSTVDAHGDPSGAWTLSARGIKQVRMIASSGSPGHCAGRLQGRSWSRPYRN